MISPKNDWNLSWAEQSDIDASCFSLNYIDFSWSMLKPVWLPWIKKGVAAFIKYREILALYLRCKRFIPTKSCGTGPVCSQPVVLTRLQWLQTNPMGQRQPSKLHPLKVLVYCHSEAEICISNTTVKDPCMVRTFSLNCKNSLIKLKAQVSLREYSNRNYCWI